MRSLFLLLFAPLAFASSVTIEPDRIEATMYDYAAWTVCSITSGGVQYLDSFDHGRCLQSAVSFDNLGEAFNPTQAGSSIDGTLPRPSSSKVLNLSADPNSLSTTTQMAYWNPVNGIRLSGHVLKQDMEFKRHRIEVTVSFTIPQSEYHSMGQYEILTGYMPAAFSRFRTIDPATGTLADLSDGPGEQPNPVIFCTADDKHCMGVVSLEPLTWGGYGRWRFIGASCMTKSGATGCVKWNAVTRVANPIGTKVFHLTLGVGSLSQVVKVLQGAQQ